MALLAGVGRSIITPRIGAVLVDYMEVSTVVHDDLFARALVIDDGQTALGLCSVELLWLRLPDITRIREAVAARCPLKPEQLLIFCTHTHSGPSTRMLESWAFSLHDRIADAIVEAYEARQPACLGAGFGQLFGYNINRRWLNRPADPSVGVLRVDRADGKPLAVLTHYGCHAVVMGGGNQAISGDFPGYASRQLEEALGVTALYAQGGAGDVNPLTETVRQRLAAGHPVGTIGHLTSYYGPDDPAQPDYWNIEDRFDGSFFEAETIARALNDEALRVWRRIELTDKVRVFSEQVIVDGSLAADEPPPEAALPHYAAILPEIAEGIHSMEIAVAGVGPAVFEGQPGEAFSETAIAFRAAAQRMGYPCPMLISYANGTYGYLPPAGAFDEGGYEVSWPRQYGISRHLQDRIWRAAAPVLEQHRLRRG
jgi:neutral ceramidase